MGHAYKLGGGGQKVCVCAGDNKGGDVEIFIGQDIKRGGTGQFQQVSGSKGQVL